MRKEKLLRAIAKYNIGPVSKERTNSTKWTVNGNMLTVHHLTLEGHCRLQVNIPGVEMEDVIFGIYDPIKFSNIISALDSEVQIQHTPGDILVINDQNTRAEFIASSVDIIFSDNFPDPEIARPFKEIPNPNVKIQLTRELCDKLIRARTALPEATTFAISASKLGNTSGIDLVVNYQSHKTNQIKISLDGEVHSDLDLFVFNLDYLHEILSVNKDFDNATMTFFSRTVQDEIRGAETKAGCDLDFHSEEFSSKYRFQNMQIL